MYSQNLNNIKSINHQPLRLPSKVMKLECLGSLHQTRLSFSRQLIDEIIKKNWKFSVSEWNIDTDGIGYAILRTKAESSIFSLIVFCHDIKDEERSDRVIADKWDMTFSLFYGEPTENEIIHMSQNLNLQEAGRHLTKQITLSRANKSVRIFNKVLNSLSKGKQPNNKLINDVGYLIRTTAVYGNGKFGIGDFLKINNKSFLKKPFQAEMLTVYLIRYFSIELINFLSKVKGGKNAVQLSDEISKHIGVGNATGLGMAPFLINHQELLHKWISAKETALSRVLAIETLNISNQIKIIQLIKQAYKYSTQWKVKDTLQMSKIEEIRKNIKYIIKNKNTSKILKKPYPLQTLIKFYKKEISFETEEMLNSLIIEPFSDIVDDIVDDMSAEEKNTIPISIDVQKIIEIIQNNYKWALKINIKKPSENYYFWYISETKLEPRLGNRIKDEGFEKELPFDIPHQIQNCLNFLISLPKKITISEAIIQNPSIKNIIKRIIINNHSPYSEIQDNLISNKTKPIDILRCKLSFFGASKYDPKSSLWTRITLFQGAPQPHKINEKKANEWLFPFLKLNKK